MKTNNFILISKTLNIKLKCKYGVSPSGEGQNR